MEEPLKTPPFFRLTGFLDRRLARVTVSVLSFQSVFLAVDLVLYAGIKSPWPYVAELIFPYVLIPVLRPLVRKIPRPLPSDLRWMAGMGLVLTAGLTLGLAALQLLSWTVKGPVNGGLFYLPGLVLALLWSWFRPKKKTAGQQP